MGNGERARLGEPRSWRFPSFLGGGSLHAQGSFSFSICWLTLRGNFLPSTPSPPKLTSHSNSEPGEPSSKEEGGRLKTRRESSAVGCGGGAWRFLNSAGIKPLRQLLKGWVDSPSRGLFTLSLAVCFQSDYTLVQPPRCRLEAGMVSLGDHNSPLKSTNPRKSLDHPRTFGMLEITPP